MQSNRQKYVAMANAKRKLCPKFKLWRTNRRHKMSKLLQRFKMFKGCQQCGYKGHFSQFDFAHIGNTKTSKTGRSFNIEGSKLTIKKQMSVCRVLCSNCHRLETYNERINKDVK